MISDVQAGIFHGSGVFLELGHFDKFFIYSTRKKSPAAKMFEFFLLETLKNSILNEKFNRKMNSIRAFFPKILALLSNYARETTLTHVVTHLDLAYITIVREYIQTSYMLKIIREKISLKLTLFSHTYIHFL